MTVITLLVMIVVVSVHGSETPRHELLLNVPLDVEVTSEGEVSGYSFKGEVPEPVAAALGRSIVGWRFEPGVPDQAVRDDSVEVDVTVEAKVADGKATYWLRRARSGSPRVVPASQERKGRLRYPAEVARQQVSGVVILAIRINQSGEVLAVHPYQTSLDRVMEDARQTGRLVETLQDSAIKAVAHWRFDMQEHEGRDGGDITIMMPIGFDIVTSSRLRSIRPWRLYVPGDIVPVPWLDESAGREWAKGHPQGSLKPRFRLASGIQDTPLR